MGKEWTAEGTYLTDVDGDLWLATQAPIEGTYDVADPMALIWSAPPRTAAYYAPTVYGSEQAVITARVDGREIGATTVSRTILPEGGAPILIEGPDLVAEFYEPAPGSQTPAPAVVVLGGSEGGIYSQLIAGLLASHGYATLAVGYFDTGPLPKTLERIPLEYFAAAFDWLGDRPEIDAGRLGVVGFSRGAELALLLGAYYPEVTAVVSYNGSGLVAPAPFIIPPVPAWTWQGEGLAFASTLEDEFAEVPVERIDGPIILISGDADGLWQSTALSRVAWDRLQ
ncbi:MAG: acyl-CoA thioesterase/BAAT N-terminal domain-containing protein, partial [Chloroflexota bacterium]|nr:acyl-CoA thioesterase/BAAT N-terminal domain-containing protein [Chloroflexota bacterium]